MTFRLPTPGLALRLLLAVACTLPFGGVAAAATYLRAAPVGIPVPVAPVNEEDERGEETADGVRAAHERNDRPAPPGLASLLPVYRQTWYPTSSGPTRPTAADPFRNGLGTPFRC